MSTNILTEHSDRVRYFLYNDTYGTVKTQDPIGWDEDEKEYSRNKEYHGIFTILSNALKFTGIGKEFIQLVDETEGINANIILTKEAKNEKTDIWEQVFSGYLDLSTMEEENNQLSIKFNAGGLESVLKSREGDDVEINRIETIDGNSINPIAFRDTNKIFLTGRNIFLNSTWEAVQMTYYKQLLVESSSGGTRTSTNTLPFEIVKKSHEQANSTYDSVDGNFDNGQATMMLLHSVDRKRTFVVSLDQLKFVCYWTRKSPINWGHVNVSLTKYRNESNFNRFDSIDLWKREVSQQDDDRDPFPNLDGTHTINGEYVITLEAGESLGLEVMIRADLNYPGPFSTYGRDFNYKLLGGNISIREDSVFPTTVCQAVKPFNLVNRLVEILTNRKNAVKSEILQSGMWKNLLITHGFWIRGFSKEEDEKLNEEERKFKPLTTSFKDFITSLSSVANVGMGIERNGVRENVVIEDLKYFYNRNTTIRLPLQIKNVKRSKDVSLFTSSLEFGFEKGGEYEEAMGLDEYNIKNSYTTSIHRVDSKYVKISKYRADSYGIEFARRKPFFNYSTEDTNYDQDIFFIDCQEPHLVNTESGDIHYVRKYADDFNNVPKGVFSPETAFNLRLSPFNTLLRHSWYFGAGLTKYPFGKVRYSSSKGNSTLETVYPENGEIQNSELERPRFVPEIIEFDHECTTEIMKMVEGKTNILGKEIRNVYGLVEFINERGNIEKGFLMSLKPNGAGKWKLLKYNK